MQIDIKQEESFSPEVQEALRNVVLAIRAVKLYPDNNPAYSTAVKKSFDALDNFLQTDEEYRIGVNKNYFTFKNLPFEKNIAINMPIVQDLFAKGVREIIFINGLTQTELLQFYQAIALTVEEQEMRSGISSILWEKNALHIKVTETGLDEVIKTQTTRRWEDKTSSEREDSASGAKMTSVKKELGFPQRTLVLFDLTGDPVSFGVNMLELAKQTKAEHETLEDRLFALYKEAGRKIDEEQPSQRETLYEGLAKSVLTLDPRYRNGFIADKLYGELDAEMANEEGPVADQNLPSAINEVQTGRFSDAWTVQQIATLLKKAALTQPDTYPLPNHLADVQVKTVDDGLTTIAREMTKYSPEDMEELKAMSETGTEWDTVRAASHTLISLIHHTKYFRQTKPEEKDINLFSSVITQLENMLNYLLKKKDYYYATFIVHEFQRPVEPVFRPKIRDALKKASAKHIIAGAINELRRHIMDSSEYRSIFAYLSAFELESTEILLKLLAEEQDRKARIFYLNLTKNIGKNQTALLGRHLSDDRWYVVRNIVNILGEGKTDQAMAFFRKAADHKNVRIRQEVISGLISIGGKKDVAFLARFLSDEDEGVQTTALRAFSHFPGISADDATYLMKFLDARPLKKKEQELTLVAIEILGNIGGRNTSEYLKKYTRIHWWRPRKLQEELRVAALRAIEEITWRIGDGR